MTKSLNQVSLITLIGIYCKPSMFQTVIASFY